jgi:hypothetical protein
MSAIDRAMGQLGRQLHIPAPGSDGSGGPRPVSHLVGCDRVAILLGAAWLADQGRCVTAATVSGYAGQSPATVTRKLGRLVVSGWLAATSADGCECGTPKRRHYRLMI